MEDHLSPLEATLTSAPLTLLPAQPREAPSTSGNLLPFLGSSGLSLQRVWAAGPQSWLPSVCLSPALSSPNAACPSWGVHCLPAACLPACSMPKPSACRLLERTNPLPGPAPPPNPVSPRGAVPSGIHHPQDAGPAWGPAPVPIGPSSAGQTGRLTVEPGGQRVAPPTLEQNMEQLEAWVPCPLSPQGGPPHSCWAAKFSVAHRTRAQADPGGQSLLTWS